MTENTTLFIAFIALIISLTGGIPGMISTYKSLTKYPKLSFILRNSITGNMTSYGKERTFILNILTIGNKGSDKFQRFVNPEAEIQIDGKWIKVKPVGLGEDFINKMSNQLGNNAGWFEML